MSKTTDGRAANTGAKGNAVHTVRRNCRKPKFKWTAKRAEMAKATYRRMSAKAKQAAKSIADLNGCAPWEVMADCMRDLRSKPKLTYVKANEPKPVIISNWDNSVEISIRGAAWQNLNEIAAIVGKWDETTYTPADIVSRFMCNGDTWKNIAAKKPSNKHCTTLAGSICDCYDSEPDMGELEKQFNAAGFLTSR